jgi:endonuclease/exonuclease/phosphatase (EEP) superfamily protein YafD
MIRILTYNIYWKFLSPEHNPGFYGQSRNQIIQFFDRFVDPPDFIFLQECQLAPFFQTRSKVLRSMTMIYYPCGEDYLTTFYQASRYTLKKLIKGTMEPNDRPWMALCVERKENKERLCIINIHAGHYTNSVWRQKLNDILQTIETTLGSKDATQYRYIMGGDFNKTVQDLTQKSNKMLHLHSHTFHVYPDILKTCCSVPSSKNPTVSRLNKYHTDHVLDSHYPIQSMQIMPVEEMSSDHKPILAVLQ